MLRNLGKNRCYSSGDGDAGQTGAFSEGLSADARQAGGDLDAGQTDAFIEGIIADARSRLPLLYRFPDNRASASGVHNKAPNADAKFAQDFCVKEFEKDKLLI